jgi:hypothetical protein
MPLTAIVTTNFRYFYVLALKQQEKIAINPIFSTFAYLFVRTIKPYTK